MARALAEIEEEVRALSSGEQERLLRVLLEELDGPADADVERAWREEAERRGRELDTGTASPVPADHVVTRTRDALRRR